MKFYYLAAMAKIFLAFLNLLLRNFFSTHFILLDKNCIVFYNIVYIYIFLQKILSNFVVNFTAI